MQTVTTEAYTPIEMNRVLYGYANWIHVIAYSRVAGDLNIVMSL